MRRKCTFKNWNNHTLMFVYTIFKAKNHNACLVPSCTVSSKIRCRYYLKTISVHVHFVSYFRCPHSAHVHVKCVRAAATQLYNRRSFRLCAFLQRYGSFQIAQPILCFTFIFAKSFCIVHNDLRRVLCERDR